jgi:uncharacterized protein
MVPVAAAICGFIFGCGLVISGLISTTKVLAFLDLFGDWDASLAVTMAAALAVAAPGFRLAQQRAHPILAPQCQWPQRSNIDSSLVIGAVLFGLGWGLVGLCPGPALANLATLSPRVLMFVAAMALGIVLHNVWQQRPRWIQKDSVTKVAADG